MSIELERLADECRRAGVINEFQELVDLGNSPRFAAMLVLQQPPAASNTDQTVSAGQRKKMEKMPPLIRSGMQKIARRAGIDTSGKFHVGALGGYSDPAAWVTCAQDVKDVAKARNIDLDGTLQHRAVAKEIAPKKTGGLAPDIVRNFERKYLASDPALAEKCRKNPKARKELRERIVANHGRQHKPKDRRPILSR